MVLFEFIIHRVVESQRSISLKNVSEIDLRYTCFIGDVRFIVEGLDFSVENIPMIDFALSLLHAIRALKYDRRYFLGFTESDEGIEFERQNDRLVVKSTYDETEASTAFDDFDSLTRQAVEGFLRHIEAIHPDLKENSNYLHQLHQAGAYT